MLAPESKLIQLKKLFRFTTFYGLPRAINKAIGRLRIPWIKKTYILSKSKNVSVIGAGQFAFSCICYFIAKNKGNVFLNCFDTVASNAKSLSNYYRFDSVSNTSNELLSNNKLEILYIASNHASHTTYSIEAMKKGVKQIQIEKPISTTYTQFIELIKTQNKHNTILYSGYNRPYSAAVKKLKRSLGDIKNVKASFSINYFISGHLIPEDHWYRKPEEGTRICGNMGHWLDLSIHILAWRSLPELINIQIAYSNYEQYDDNISVSLTTELGDLISIMLTSRTEPFEGINESVNFQFQETIAKIDDFRKIKIWKNDQLIKKRFFPKDVGHKRTILQPFYSPSQNRDWSEVKISTLLMLHITKMVKKQTTESMFNLKQEMNKFEKDVKK